MVSTAEVYRSFYFGRVEACGQKYTDRSTDCASRRGRHAVHDLRPHAGGTFADTAESCQAGQSEEIPGELLTGRRSRFTLATKFPNGVGSAAGVMRTGNSRKNRVRAVEDSLRRLRTDCIDLLWVHFSDTVTPIEEILRALDDLARQGKIHHAGLSDFPAWRTSRAVILAELRGLLEYSLVERTADREILPMAEALGLGGALWSPLGGGLLTGKYRTSTESRLTDWKRLVHTESDQRKTAVADTVLAVAEEIGARTAQVAVAWVREHAARAATPLVPVIGPRTPAQLEDYLGALDVRLDAEQFRGLDEVSRVPSAWPTTGSPPSGP